MNGQPKHIHTCQRPLAWNDVEPWEAHQWDCESPYCNYPVRVCPLHGGTRPRLDEPEYWDPRQRVPGAMVELEDKPRRHK